MNLNILRARRARKSSSLIWNKIAYVFVHLRVVEHGDELLHEGLVCDLLVEGCAASVHKDVDQAQRKEKHAQLSHLQSLQNIVSNYLSTTKNCNSVLRLCLHNDNHFFCSAASGLTFGRGR